MTVALSAARAAAAIAIVSLLLRSIADLLKQDFRFGSEIARSISQPAPDFFLRCRADAVQLPIYRGVGHRGSSRFHLCAKRVDHEPGRYFRVGDEVSEPHAAG